MTRRLVQAYKLVSPTDEVFYAAIVFDGGEVVVETMRPFAAPERVISLDMSFKRWRRGNARV